MQQVNNEGNTFNNSPTTVTGNEKKKRNKDRFVFKEFTIFHNLCAMKVGTDGVLIGGYAASLVANNDDKKNENNSWPLRILDVGCGSGVITMMLAQKYSNAIIDSVDIDADAIKQTKINLEQKPEWAQRISCHHTPIQEYSINHNKESLYDLIVCAPPYFVTALNEEAEQRMEHKRIVARHLIGDKSYQLSDLFNSIRPLLKPGTGRFSFIFPSRDNIWKTIDNSGFTVNHTVYIRDNPDTQIIRNIYVCSIPDTEHHESSPTSTMTSTDFSIYTELVPKKTTVQVRRKYTQEYKTLLEEFCNHMD